MNPVKAGLAKAPEAFSAVQRWADCRGQEGEKLACSRSNAFKEHFEFARRTICHGQ